MNPQSPADPSSLPQRYAERHRVATHQAELIDRKNPMFILLRTALFCAGAVALLAGYSNVAPATVWQWLGWLCLAAFFIAVVWHENLKEKSELAKFIAATYQWLLDRTERNWSALKSRQIPVIIDKSPLSDDLDLRGPNSLLNWLSLAQTQDGHRTMENWMLEVPSATEMVRRQEAVKALEPLHDMRESFVIESRTLQHAADERMRLREWASEVPWLVQRPWFLLVRLIGPLAFIIGAGMVLVARQADSEQMFRVSAWCMLAGIAWNLASTIIWGGQVHEGFMKLSGGYHDTRHYLRLFELMRGLPQSSPGSILHTLRQHSVEGPESAVAGFIALNRLTRFTSLHRTPTTFLIYLVVQLLFLWDFQVLVFVDRWQIRFGRYVAKWYAALGECEALISAATAAAENPSWTYPDPQSVTPEVPLQVTELGHPLLPDQVRVPNDLRMNQQQPLLLVTGSNMAGKSTLMRALGVNLVLARFGTRVCASRFQAPAFELATSIRVRDSLAEGVSFFMSELKRLREVVELAERCQRENQPVFFLLDEILQGTNSRERQIAVAHVLQRLLGTGAIGAMSTHDLELADLPAMATVSQIVHFREFFDTVDGKKQMRFDYRMYVGPTPTTNALALLELVGLADENLGTERPTSVNRR